MKLSKIILSLAFAGTILSGVATSASADTVTYPSTQAATNNRGTYNQTQTTQTTPTTSAATATTAATDTSAVVTLAKQLASQNIPYIWGGESLTGMDCSA
ncbi:C40 family peptidase [Lentilactobacillus kisonensis]|uniref:C40 family peptidase n=1 Tax=Lentilactobacillus kisonensis TaxID=481722 RepID=UPI000ABF564A|nr:C40 family peptidase [Lentilactobacillus kisonensis]